VRLTRLRGKFMQEAVPAGQGAMAALMGLEKAAVDELCQEAGKGEVVSAANLNGAGQIVIAGAAAAVDRAVGLAKQKGAKRAVMLQVSAPFHCALMQPAADRLDDELDKIRLGTLKVPVVSNVEAEPNVDVTRVRKLLVQQVTAPVRWEESVQRLAGLGVARAFELGSGAVLAGLVKRIAPSIKLTTIGEPHEVDAYAV
jgi:[acyl-carrier-protein] S-malonyltransferase